MKIFLMKKMIEYLIKRLITERLSEVISSYIQEADKKIVKGEDKRSYVKNRIKEKTNVSMVSNQQLNTAIELIVMFKRL